MRKWLPLVAVCLPGRPTPSPTGTSNLRARSLTTSPARRAPARCAQFPQPLETFSTRLFTPRRPTASRYFSPSPDSGESPRP
jgi:hypothetical protein